MPTSGKWHRRSHFAVAVASTATILLPAHAALASQGPGGGPGTASSFIQLAMAIIVYGTSALVVGGGLIGTMRNALRHLFLFDAFSSREPVPTPDQVRDRHSLENAMA